MINQDNKALGGELHLFSFYGKSCSSNSCRGLLIPYLESLIKLHPEITSPIEKRFFLAWKIIELRTAQCSFDLIPQYKDESTGKYFIDFIIFSNSSGFNKKFKLGIEIDGHWHEKTKGQVKKDKERERFLISNGWIIFRFAGSEIYYNPFICIREIFNLIHERIKNA